MRLDESNRTVQAHRVPIVVRQSTMVVLLSLAFFVLVGGAAWDHTRVVAAATPTLQDEPEVLTECTVPPVRRRILVEVAQAPPGIARRMASGDAVVNPAPPAGVPADPDIAASVRATARQMVACYNAGDLRRLFALYSEEYLFRVWGGFAGADPNRAELMQTLAFISTPVPQPESAQVAFISVEDVRQLPNGDVSAIVNLSNGSSRSVFTDADGRYQLVWSYPLPDPTAP